MGEWFHIMGEFGGFSVFYSHSAVSKILGPIMECFFRFTCLCVLGHSRMSVSSHRVVGTELDGSPFLVVGIVSWGQMAVLHSSIPGQQSGETPDLNPDLVSLLSHYLWY